MLTVVKCVIGRGALALPVCTALLMAACGPGSSMSAGQAPNPPPPPAMTAVTVVISSTANDELTEFDISLESLSLTSASGKQVTVPVTAGSSEFVHVNGTNEPVVTAMVPQDTYISATATVGSATFGCVNLLPGGAMDVALFAYGQTPTANVSVMLPSSVVVSREPVGLSLNLNVSRSASFNLCGADSAYAITPTFTLSSFAFPAAAATADNGAVRGLDGEVTALDSNSLGFRISLPSTTSVHVTVDSATVWQGVAAVSDLRKGTFIDLDGAVRNGGSVAATRVAVADPTAVDVQRGPLINVANSEPVLEIIPRQAQGKDQFSFFEVFDFSSSTFAISGAFANLGSLPFTASFTAQNMVAGQTVYVSSPAFNSTGSYNAAANTVTLMPQSVNGTVTGVSTSGDFTVYSVSLAPYDLFPMLAAQPGQTTLLTNPGVIEVYADASTTMLTDSSPRAGDTLRFYGLVFNDQGTLRMDCAQVSPGVTALSQTANPLIS